MLPVTLPVRLPVTLPVTLPVRLPTKPPVADITPPADTSPANAAAPVERVNEKMLVAVVPSSAYLVTTK